MSIYNSSARISAIYLVLPLLLMALFFTFSCTKDDLRKPVINSVRLTDASKADSTFTSAKPGMYIVIQGQNLDNATQILFNDYPATFNPTYNNGRYIVVQIPLDTPTPDRGEVSNTIKVITPSGTAVYEFNTVPPPPSLSYVFNYNTKPGDVMEINGKFLFGINEVIFPGGKKGTNISKNADGTILYVTVPSDLTETGTILFKSPYGDLKSPFKVNTINEQSTFATFEPTATEPGCGCWWTVPTSTGTMDNTMYPNSTGNYVRLTFSAIPGLNGGYTSGGRTYNYGGPATKVILDPSVLSQAPDDYYLMFEINTKKPVTGGALRVSFGSGWNAYSGSYQYDVLLARSEPNNVFDTKNKWRTVYLPLKDLVLWQSINWSTWEAGTTKPIVTLSEIFKPTGAMAGFALKTFVTANSGGFGDFDAAFDNFRIEKISK